jgi:hypothetical protein
VFNYAPESILPPTKAPSSKPSKARLGAAQTRKGASPFDPLVIGFPKSSRHMGLHGVEHELHQLMTYLPLLTSLFSLLTAIAVASVGFRFSRSIEAGKVRASYLNYALQKIMDEYTKYNPVIELSDDSQYVRLIEERFKECRESILRISPLISDADLDRLHEIELKHSNIIRNQQNNKLNENETESISLDEYTKMLTNYINFGHELLKIQVKNLRKQLEKGKFH